LAQPPGSAVTSAVARIAPALERCPGDVEPGAVASSAIAATPMARKAVLADVCAASLGGMLGERIGLVQ
jgi:hypothetical protein